MSWMLRKWKIIFLQPILRKVFDVWRSWEGRKIMAYWNFQEAFDAHCPSLEELGFTISPNSNGLLSRNCLKETSAWDNSNSFFTESWILWIFFVNSKTNACWAKDFDWCLQFTNFQCSSHDSRLICNLRKNACFLGFYSVFEGDWFHSNLWAEAPELAFLIYQL